MVADCLAAHDSLEVTAKSAPWRGAAAQKITPVRSVPHSGPSRHTKLGLGTNHVHGIREHGGKPRCTAWPAYATQNVCLWSHAVTSDSPDTLATNRAGKQCCRHSTVGEVGAASGRERTGVVHTLKNGGVKKAVKKGAQGQGAMKSLYTGGTAGPAIVDRTRTTMSCWSCTDASCRDPTNPSG